MVKACGKTRVIIDAEKGKLQAALRAGVFMAKPNLYELETFNNERYGSYEEMIGGCKKLIDLGAENVMLSFGKRGSIFTDGKESYFCKSMNVAVNSTVGAGDCYGASFLHHYLRSGDIAAAIRFAAARCCVVVSNAEAIPEAFVREAKEKAQ